MRILVIGNCQARPLAQILTGGGGHVALDPIIVHLAKEADAGQHQALMEQADLILTQYTAPNFRPAHLEMRGIKDRFPGKTLSWPNIFYAGQTPFLRYATHLEWGRLSGPLDVYHDLRLLRDWFVARMGECPFALPASQEDVHRQSIAELMAREKECDIGVADLIETRHADRLLFFTFNHPTRWLLDRLANRIADRFGFRFDAAGFTVAEPLGRISPPHGMANGVLEPETYRGVDTGHDGPGPVPLVDYDRDSLRAVQFRCYDQQEEILLDHARIRLTPQFH